MPKIVRLAPFLALSILIIGFPALAADVTLLWDANTETNIAGYRVYYGSASRAYVAPISVGNQTTYTVKNLGPGTYYFAVTAFDTTGAESDFSNEVSKTITGTTIPCDINGDGVVNSSDVQALGDAILTLLPASPAFDLNRDGKVDALDLQILINVTLGLRTCP